MRTSSVRIVVLAAVAMSVAVPILAQTRRTIPAAARNWDKSRGPLYASSIVEYGVVPFEMMARDADLIVVGSVRVVRTFLSEDQTDLYTEYEVSPTRVFAQRRSRVTATPGPNPILIKHLGGRTEIDGVEVIVEEATLKLLPTNVPLILFLLYNGDDNRYRVYAHSIGALAVENARVRPLFQQSADTARFVGMDYEQFVRQFTLERQAPPK